MSEHAGPGIGIEVRFRVLGIILGLENLGLGNHDAWQSNTGQHEEAPPFALTSLTCMGVNRGRAVVLLQSLIVDKFGSDGAVVQINVWMFFS